MRKSQTTAFYSYFFCIGKHILLENIFEKTWFILLHLHYRFFHVAGYWKCSNNNGFVDAILF